MNIFVLLSPLSLDIFFHSVHFLILNVFILIFVNLWPSGQCNPIKELNSFKN